MATSRSEIEGWLKRGMKSGARWVLVVSDTFSHEHYPVFVTSDSDIQAEGEKRDGPNMQQVTECYDLAKPLEPQLAEMRAFHGYTPRY